MDTTGPKPTDVCDDCGSELVVGTNWSQCFHNHGRKRCTPCHTKRPSNSAEAQRLRKQKKLGGIPTKQESTTHPMQSYVDAAVKESMQGQVNRKSPVSCGFVYGGWIEHYGPGLHTAGQAQNLKRRKGNHQRDCPFRDFHYLPTCTLFVYNMDKAEKALLRHFRSKFKPSHEKGDWFYCTRAEAIAAFHEFVQLYSLEEEANECHR